MLPSQSRTTMNSDENLDPRHKSKLPMPTQAIKKAPAPASTTIATTTTRPSLKERTNGIMPPPSSKPRHKLVQGQSILELHKAQKSRQAQTSIPRARSANGSYAGYSGLHRRSNSETEPSTLDDEETSRIMKVHNALDQDPEQYRKKLESMVREYKTSEKAWELERVQLKDKIGDLEQDRDEERKKAYDERYEMKRGYEERFITMEKDHATVESNLRIELTNQIIELKEAAASQADVLRVKIRQQIEQEQKIYIDRKNEEIEHLKASLVEERQSLLRQHQQEVSSLKSHYEEEKSENQKAYSSELQKLQEQFAKQQQDDRRQLEDYAHQLEHNANQTNAQYEKEIQEIKYTYTQERKRLTEQLEQESKRIRQLNVELEEAKERSQSEQHETATLRKTLAELSESSVSIESVAKGQQTQIAELQYQLDEQKKKATEFRMLAQRADEERTAAKAKLLKEELLRRKLHNQVQELKGNIRVFCRVRPVLTSEKNQGAAQIEFPDEDEDGQEILLKGENVSSTGTVTQKLHQFQFDKVFSPSSSNLEVFDEISQLVQSALDGYNVCIFAYGQTGSGKTHTMSAEDDGMIPRAINQIFHTGDSMKERGWIYKFEGQFLEIYNENLNDLLGKADMIDKTKLEIHHDAKERTTSVSDLTTVTLNSPEQVHQVLSRASRNRSVAATKMNERSSRSHSVFIFRIRGTNTITGKSLEGTLNLIDLAGSERLAQSQVTGDRLRETQSINKSLSALGDVINSLGNSKENGHVPYRNSKLTYLLQYSLSGNSKTLMFVNVSPLEPHVNETLSSLRFATNVNNTKIRK